MQRTLKWSPAQPFKKPDNIISSKAREIGDYGFKPSYLSEPTENMRFIMSNEYMKIWFRERGKYEKDTYSREEIIKEESKIKRRFVQRMMTYKKPNKNNFLEEKLEKMLEKKDSKEQPVDYRKFKYKPACTKPNKGNSKKSKGKTFNSLEEKESEDSKLADDNQAVIVCQVDPTRCVPCQAT